MAFAAQSSDDRSRSDSGRVEGESADKPVASDPSEGWSTLNSGGESDAPAHQDPTLISLEAGGRLGRYLIVQKLGEGGMGAVYLAEDTQLAHRKVALKVCRNTLRHDPAALERFRREAHSSAKLDHPNICKVYDFGTLGDVQYLAMAFVDGKPLSEIIKARRIQTRQAALLVRKLALTLQEAHDEGVVHRDLKPANIMIDRRKEPVIVDFGLALMTAAQDLRLTNTGAILGTPAYMAPEQVRGDVELMGPACDIYALGVILYELLTGTTPFVGQENKQNIFSVLLRIETEAPSPPSQHRADLDPRLEAICLRAISKKIEDRQGSMKELADELTEYLRSIEPRAETSTAAVASPSPADTLSRLLKIEEDSFALRPDRDCSKADQPPMPPARLWLLGAGALGLLVILGIFAYVMRGREPLSIDTLNPPPPLLASDPAPDVSGGSSPADDPSTNSPEWPEWPAANPFEDQVRVEPPTFSSSNPLANDTSPPAVPAADDWRGLRGTAIRYPYVYLIDGFLDRPGRLWVFRISDGLSPSDRVPQPILRLVRSTGSEASQPLLNEKEPIPKVQEIDQIEDAGVGNALLIRDDVLYCPRSGALEVYSLADPARPSHLGSFGTARGDATTDLISHLDKVYSINRKRIVIYDVSTPSNPISEGILEYDGDGVFWAGCAVGQYLYVGKYPSGSEALSTGIVIFDISSPEHPKEVGYVETWKTPYRLLPTKGGGMVAMMDERVQLYGLDDPLQPAPLGEPVRPYAGRTGVILSGEKEYIVVPGSVFSVGSEGLDVEVRLYPSSNNASAIPHQSSVQGNYAAIPTDRGVMVLATSDAPPPEASRPFHRSFNGENLDGWFVESGDPSAWRVERDQIVAQANRQNQGWLFTEDKYSDFTLRLQFQLDDGANSGLTFRAEPDQEHLEIQLIDESHPSNQNLPLNVRTGALWKLAMDRQAPLAPKTPDSWNSLEIRLIGPRLEVTVNAVKVLDTDLNRIAPEAPELRGLSRRAGHIGLQAWEGTVRFRNIEILESGNPP